MEPDENELRELRLAKVREFLAEFREQLIQLEPLKDAPGKGRHANAHARAKRNEKIVELAAEGKSQQEIAAEVNLAQSTVNDVLRKFKNKAA